MDGRINCLKALLPHWRSIWLLWLPLSGGTPDLSAFFAFPVRFPAKPAFCSSTCLRFISYASRLTTSASALYLHLSACFMLIQFLLNFTLIQYLQKIRLLCHSDCYKGSLFAGFQVLSHTGSGYWDWCFLFLRNRILHYIVYHCILVSILSLFISHILDCLEYYGNCLKIILAVLPICYWVIL